MPWRRFAMTERRESSLRGPNGSAREARPDGRLRAEAIQGPGFHGILQPGGCRRRDNLLWWSCRVEGALMPKFLARALSALVAVVLPATFLHAALESAPDRAASLAGQILIAAPSMRDPRFDHAVI